jgi:hypothetical protein
MLNKNTLQTLSPLASFLTYLDAQQIDSNNSKPSLVFRISDFTLSGKPEDNLNKLLVENNDQHKNLIINMKRLFKDITDLNNQKIISDKHTVNPGEPSRTPYHPLQIWCADMWAVLWNVWKRGAQTICHNDLQFSWATSHISDWDKYNINHNAGVVNDKTGLFYKGLYQRSLPPKDLEIKPENCSFNYYQLVKQL